MKHILGYGPKAYNLDLKRTTYMREIEISDEVLDWLNMHDTKKSPEGGDIFVVNALEYEYLGPKFEENGE